MFGWAVLRVKTAALVRDEPHFVQVSVGRDKQTVWRACFVKVIADPDDCLIGQRQNQITSIACVRQKISLTQVKGNFLTSFRMDHIGIGAFSHRTTLHSTRLIANDEFYRLHNTTALPLCPFYADHLVIIVVRQIVKPIRAGRSKNSPLR